MYTEPLFRENYQAINLVMLLAYMKCSYKLLAVQKSKNENIHKYSQMPNTKWVGDG